MQSSALLLVFGIGDPGFEGMQIMLYYITPGGWTGGYKPAQKPDGRRPWFGNSIVKVAEDRSNFP